MSAVEKFPILLSEAEEESSAVPPCFSHEGINVCENPATCSVWLSELSPLPATCLLPYSNQRLRLEDIQGVPDMALCICDYQVKMC